MVAAVAGNRRFQRYGTTVNTERMLGYPVVRIKGGTAQQRQLFTRELLAALRAMSLSVWLADPSFSAPSAVWKKALQHDLVIVDELPGYVVHTISVASDSGIPKGDDLCWTPDGEIEVIAGQLLSRLHRIAGREPLWACVLIGGRSSRMGRAKHLLTTENGQSWLENTVSRLKPFVDGLVIAGEGVIPERLRAIPHIPDLPKVGGPISGLLSAMRWQPQLSWLLVACDMPCISSAAVEWLLSLRRAGVWGLVPKLAEGSHLEPLFAWYSPRSAQLFEAQMFSESLRIADIAASNKIATPLVPDNLRESWKNINIPEQLLSICSSQSEG